MNSVQPLITISIPVYNCEKYIERCLRSVIAQTYPNIEVLLVNDCSPDGSAAIIEKIIKANPHVNIRLKNLPANMGSSVARNKGIEEAKGEYLFFVDSDDEILPFTIEKIYEKIAGEKAQMAEGQIIVKNLISGETNDKFFQHNTSIAKLTGNTNILKAFVNEDYTMLCYNKLFDLQFLRANNLYFYPSIYSQDELWAFDLALKLESVALLHEITYIYNFREGSVTNTKTRKNFEDHQLIAEKFTASFLQEKSNYRRTLIKIRVISFKETTLQMQWKFLKDDKSYWKKNYSRLQKAPKLSLKDYFNPGISLRIKKINFLQNLPPELGYRIFKFRYERTF